MATRSLFAAALLPQLIAAGILPRQTVSSTPTSDSSATISSPAEPTSTLPTVIDCLMSSAANDGDTCDSFAERWGYPASYFQGLNPDVTCPGDLVAGQSYCIIGDVTTVSVLPTITSSAPSTTDLTSLPSPTQSGLSLDCGSFYFPAGNDSCSSIETAFNITSDQFEAWNPSTDCSGLVDGYYVCVSLLNATARLPPTSVPASLTTLVRRATSTSSTATASATGSGYPSPLAWGTADDCVKYHEVVSGDTCSDIATEYNTTSEQLIEWNKDLNAST